MVLELPQTSVTVYVRVNILLQVPLTAPSDDDMLKSAKAVQLSVIPAPLPVKADERASGVV